jgi:hypothetical protein
MKVSKTALLVLGIGIFIIVFATLFTLYSGQSAEQALLSKNLAASQGFLPELLAEKDDLDDQLAQWEGELDEVMLELSQSEGRFPKSVESIEYDEVIFKLAEQSGLLIINLMASDPMEEVVEGTDIIYNITTIEVVVRNGDSPPASAGDFEIYIDETVDKALEFIHLIVTTPDFGVATIKMVAVEALDPPEELDGSETGPEATIKLAIYGFPR